MLRKTIGSCIPPLHPQFCNVLTADKCLPEAGLAGRINRMEETVKINGQLVIESLLLKII